MPIWTNADGLIVKFGTTEGVSGAAGEYNWPGPRQLVECVINGTNLTSSDVVQDYNVVIPKNARVERVEVYVETAFTSGGSATLTVGGWGDLSLSEDTSAGFVAAIPVASLTAGALFDISSPSATYAGSYVGSTPTVNVQISAKYGTAAFTAGKAYVRIYFAINPV